jgi:DNA polymerase IV
MAARPLVDHHHGRPLSARSQLVAILGSVARRTEPTILHADLDAFYAAVEQRDDPRLRGKPVIVGGGVVLAASYEARRFGVHSAMGGREARRLCPRAVVVEPRMSAYVEASRAVFAAFDDITPLVEPLSIDEAFLDVAGAIRLLGPVAGIAAQLRRRVATDLGLPLSVGAASTKFLAKVASGVAKPDGLVVVQPEHELEFLHPLGVDRLWGVGAVTQRRLARMGIRTVGELAAVGAEVLVSALGPAAGMHLHRLAHNLDPRPVRTDGRRKSVGAQQAFGGRGVTMAEVDRRLLGLADRVGRRLRAGQRVGRTLTVRFRFADHRRASRACSLAPATASTGRLHATAVQLAHDLLQLPAAQLPAPVPDDEDRGGDTGGGGAAAGPAVQPPPEEGATVLEHRGLTLLGIAVSSLRPEVPEQLTLPFLLRRVAPDRAVDEVRERFGRDAIGPASLLGRGRGIEAPIVHELE